MNKDTIPTEAGLKVMGARSQHGGDIEVDNLLRALESTTLKPVRVFWRYEDESEAVYAETFRDSKPGKALIVSNEVIRINPVNVMPVDGEGVTALVLDDATGCSYNQGVYQPDAILPRERNHDITRARSFTSEAAFINRQGQLSAAKVLPKELAALADVVDIQSGFDFCVALRANGSLVFWADDKSRVPAPPAEISTLTDIRAIYHNGYSVVVLRQNGTLMSWGIPSGYTNFGSTIPSDIANFSDYVRVWPAQYSYVALRKNGQIVSWGDGETGRGFGVGGMPGTIRVLEDIVHVALAGTGCVALRANGQMVGWGCNATPDPEQSAWLKVPSEYAQLNDIIDVKSVNGYAFVALRKNGTLVIWGNLVNFGRIPYLTDVTAIATNSETVTALHSNGTVTTFGYFGDVDNWNKIKHELVNVCAIYSDGGFIAITEDQRVIGWGSYGAKVLEEMTGRISYQKPHRLPHYPDKALTPQE